MKRSATRSDIRMRPRFSILNTYSIYVFSMVSLGWEYLISDLVVADFFMHSLSGMIRDLLYLAALFYTEGVLHEI